MERRMIIKRLQFQYHQLYNSIVQNNKYNNTCNYYKDTVQQQYTTITATLTKVNIVSKTTTTTLNNSWLVSSSCQRCSTIIRNNNHNNNCGYNINNKVTSRTFSTTNETIPHDNDFNMNNNKTDTRTIYTKNNSSSSNIRYLDLRGCGLSILERLCLEECLYQLDIYNNWIIVGYHDATTHKYFVEKLNNSNNNTNHHQIKPIAINNYLTTDCNIDNEQIVVNDDIDNNEKNTNVAIILGIGGKVHDLLNVPNVQKDTVLCIKRFTGGGTVVLDNDCIWTTIIGRRSNQQDKENATDTCSSSIDSNSQKEQHVYNNNKQHIQSTIFDNIQEFFPRPIMKWTVDTIYNKVFIKLQQKQNEYKHKQEQMKQQQQQQQQQQPTQRLAQGYTDTTNFNIFNKISPKKTLVVDTKSCSYDNTGRVITIPNSTRIGNNEYIELSSSTVQSPIFALLENDYVMTWSTKNGNPNLNETINIDNTNNVDSSIIKKIGGNAQAIGKNGFIHHTSFLWDYDNYNMKQYLQIPKKHPTYRNNRVHDTFVCSIQSIYPNLQKSNFIQCIQEVCYELFTTTNNNNNKYNNTEPSKSTSTTTTTTSSSTIATTLPSEPNFKHVTIHETMAIVNTITNGIGLQGWYEQKSRNKIVTDLSK